WQAPAARGGHRRTILLLWPLVRQRPPQRIGGVPRTNADKMEKKALAELAEENVGNHPWSVVSSPWSVVKVGLCAVTAGKVVPLEQARALMKMTCASGTNGLRSGQNDLRDLAKWFAQLAKWFAPHFENNGH